MFDLIIQFLIASSNFSRSYISVLALFAAFINLGFAISFPTFHEVAVPISVPLVSS